MPQFKLIEYLVIANFLLTGVSVAYIDLRVNQSYPAKDGYQSKTHP
jgi:hypothetical protein